MDEMRLAAMEDLCVALSETVLILVQRIEILESEVHPATPGDSA